MLVSNGLLGRQTGNGDSGPRLNQFLVKLKELVESSLALPKSLFVSSLARVDSVAGLVGRIVAEEFGLVTLLNQIVVLVVDLGVHLVFAIVFTLQGILHHFLLLCVRHYDFNSLSI